MHQASACCFLVLQLCRMFHTLSSHMVAFLWREVRASFRFEGRGKRNPIRQWILYKKPKLPNYNSLQLYNFCVEKKRD